MQELLNKYLKSRKQQDDIEQFNFEKKQLNMRQLRRKEQILVNIRRDTFLYPRSMIHNAALIKSAATISHLWVRIW